MHLSEIAQRPIAIDEKNWLFAGSKCSGCCAAAIPNATSLIFFKSGGYKRTFRKTKNQFCFQKIGGL